jgi:hypothetical protein
MLRFANICASCKNRKNSTGIPERPYLRGGRGQYQRRGKVRREDERFMISGMKIDIERRAGQMGCPTKANTSKCQNGKIGNLLIYNEIHLYNS